MPLRLLFDGECPFCRREVEWLKRRDRENHLVLEDIASATFDPAAYGLTAAEVQAGLHAILPDGHVVRRMDAIRAAYRAIGLGWLVAPTSWPGLRMIFDPLYLLFARHRVTLGGWFGRGHSCGTGCRR